MTTPQRKVILDRAREMFSRQSYHAISLEKISSSLGIGKSTIYHYFPTKQALFTEMLKDSVSGLYKYVYSRLDKDQSIEDQIYGLIKAVLEYFEENQDVFLLLLRERMDFLDLESIKQQLDSDFLAEYDRFIGHFREMVDGCKKDGQLVDVESSVILASIFGTINASALSLIRNHPERRLTELVDDCYQVVAKGILR